MKIINLTIFFTLFIVGCSKIDFVILDSPKKSLNNITSYTVSGDVSTYYAEALMKGFGVIENNSNKKLIINLSSSEEIIKTVVGTNQVASSVQHNITANYELITLSGACKKISKTYKFNFTHYPKSEGFNFGTDRSLKEAYQNNVYQNVIDFKNFVINEHNIESCLDET